MLSLLNTGTSLRVRVTPGKHLLEEAINKMTYASAQRMRVTDRGVLQEGIATDITIFNPHTVIDNATTREPHQYPTSKEYVIVNGRLPSIKVNTLDN